MGPTYTFSRALHMMRYSGAKMRPEFDSLGHYYVEGRILKHSNTEMETDPLDASEIMGNWVEVK